MGHQFVKPDWKRFRPTKAVNRPIDCSRVMKRWAPGLLDLPNRLQGRKRAKAKPVVEEPQRRAA